MGRLRGLAVVWGLLLCACAGTAGHTPDPAASQPAAGQLPALAELPVTRLPLATTEQVKLTSANVVSSANTLFVEDRLVLSQTPLSYAVLGLAVGNYAPAQLALSGQCHGLWVGVSDYEQESWRWIGAGLDTAQTLDLSPYRCARSGIAYFALICPAGDYATLDLELALVGDPPAQWNLLVWMGAGRGDQGEATFAEIQELEAVGSTEEINVLVSYKVVDLSDTPYTGVDKTYQIKVVQDSDPHGINVTGDPANRSFSLEEFDTTSPQNLASFVKWAETYFPAQRTVLILRGEGYGCWDEHESDPDKSASQFQAKGSSGMLSDSFSGRYGLTPNHEIAEALLGHEPDILVFDASMLGMIEALYDYRESAELLVACQADMPGPGFPLQSILTAWNAAPAAKASEVAGFFIDKTLEDYSGTSEEFCVAVIDSAKLAAIVDVLAQMSEKVVATSTAETEPMLAALAAIDGFDYLSEDLTSFLAEYGSRTGNPEIAGLAEAALESVDEAVVKLGQVHQPNQHGISAFIPGGLDTYPRIDWNGTSIQHFQTAFSQRVPWLRMFASTGSPCTRPRCTNIVWQAGERVYLAWDDPTGDLGNFDLIIDSPSWRYGSPTQPDDLAGIVEFSEDSKESGVTEEWAELLPEAPAGIYELWVLLEIGDHGPWPDSMMFDITIRDADGALVHDLGGYNLDPGSGIVFRLVFNKDNRPQVPWTRGDRVELTWNVPSEDLDLMLWAPPDYWGIMPGEYGWLFAGSGNSLFTGEARESMTLLGGPAGLYLVTPGICWSVNTPVIVNARLYDANGVQKENLGYYEVTPDEYADTPLLAILEYDN